MNISNLGQVDLLLIFVKAFLICPFTYIGLIGMTLIYVGDCIEKKQSSLWTKLENDILIYECEYNSSSLIQK